MQSDKLDTVGQLAKLRQAYKTEHRGFRQKQYEILAEAMSIAVKLRKDPEGQLAFAKKAGIPFKSEDGRLPKDWLTIEVIAFVMNARTAAGRKLAWKRARVMNFLVDHCEVKPEHIRSELTRRGGLETVVGLAARKKPLRVQTSLKKEVARASLKLDPTLFKKLKKWPAPSRVRLIGKIGPNAGSTVAITLVSAKLIGLKENRKKRAAMKSEVW